ncbi:UDP-N-acetylmuramoyl-L-alanyl-D-glutamate--2,6-diaminopimelate ligase [Gudongella sp. DL1XJH-153]|uniref:UDP-N-acetylmuramoyl-L-alanyl-D-glutamate--2, 6-diaminopimelate ligase n=1 Tax=Gudongella sp. DL1XJH-153 TaxID=3409804 RepID=UPI003BB7BEF1
MNLKKLVSSCKTIATQGSLDIDIEGVCYDSKKCSQNFVFVAIRGLSEDGNKYISNAVNKGAVAIVSDRPVEESFKGRVYVRVDDTRKALSIISNEFYKWPSERIRVIGVTGTNGKTSTTYFLKQIFENSGKRIGLIGTLGAQFENMNRKLVNTTPESLDIQMLLSEMDYLGAEYVVMEVSSQGVDMGRIDHITFREGIFTNLTQDHLDYHKTMEKYYTAKKKFLQMPTDFLVVNRDNIYGERFLSEAGDQAARIISYGSGDEVEVKLRNIVYNSDSVEFSLLIEDKQLDFITNLAGEFNIYNVSGAILVALQEGIEFESIYESVKKLNNVPGRMQKVDTRGQFQVVIDYAHTPDGLYNVLSALRKSCKGRLITVFGAGGDRDRDKRSIMGEIVSKMSDICIVTSDNPRWENPDRIIEDILKGVSKTNKEYKVISDRYEAIREGISLAQKNDIILVAGKGHEIWQSIKGVNHPFDEKEIVIHLAEEKFGINK